MKRNRSKKCPEVLEEYISLVNGLPSSYFLVTPSSVLKKWKESYEAPNPAPSGFEYLSKDDLWEIENFLWPLTLLEKLESHYKPLPKQIRNYLFEAKPKRYKSEEEAKKKNPQFFAAEFVPDHGSISGGDLLDFELFEAEHFLRECLEPRIQTLTTVRELFGAIGGVDPWGVSKRGWHPGGGGVLSFATVTLQTSPSGVVEFGGNDIYEAIARGDIDATRIRLCPICGRFFWATRSNRKACDERCVSTLRQRNYRNRDKDKEAEAKRNNRKYKKLKKKI